MTIVGFSFTKIFAEKSNAVKGKINVSNNVTIKNVSESKIVFDPAKKALKFEFLYTSKYEPEVGIIELGGELVYLAEEADAKTILNSWKKDKKVSGDMMKGVMNNILAKCNVESIILSRDINLPAPIPLPKLN
jgi:hypothetical protein